MRQHEKTRESQMGIEPATFGLDEAMEEAMREGRMNQMEEENEEQGYGMALI